MNVIFRSLAQANAVRIALGEGEPGLMPLLGGWGSTPDEGELRLGGGSSGAYSRIAQLRGDTRMGGGSGSSSSSNNNGAGGITGCVAVDMRLPNGLRAGDVRIGDLLEVVDPRTCARRRGRVSFSEPKMQLCFRLEWKNGVVLVCSETAPIPTADGTLRTPLELCGEESLTELDGRLALSPIVRVERVGLHWVQHITCENACFLVGAVAGRYALHHNIKNGTTDTGPV